MMKNCGHTEGEFNKRGIKVDRHNCSYVDAINSFISRAEKMADLAVRGVYKLDDTEQVGMYRQAWDRAFHRAMNDLTTDHRRMVSNGCTDNSFLS